MRRAWTRDVLASRKGRGTRQISNPHGGCSGPEDHRVRSDWRDSGSGAVGWVPRRHAGHLRLRARRPAASGTVHRHGRQGAPYRAKHISEATLARWPAGWSSRGGRAEGRANEAGWAGFVAASRLLRGRGTPCGGCSRRNTRRCSSSWCGRHGTERRRGRASTPCGGTGRRSTGIDIRLVGRCSRARTGRTSDEP